MTAEQIPARAAHHDEAELALAVLCAAFRIDCDAARPLYYQDPFFDLSHKRILFDPDGVLVSCLTVVPSTLMVGGVPVPLGGIAGVATRPERQGEGHASRLLAATVSDLTDELRYPISALFPFSYDYYRRFGWETASGVVRWTAAPDTLPRCVEAFGVHPPQDDAERRAIRQLHQAAIHGCTGACARDARRWRVIEEMSPNRDTVVYESRPGTLDGYLLFERRWDETSRETLSVQEMHGRTPEARRGLIGWLASQSASVLEWPAAARDLQEYGLSCNEVGGRMPIEPGMMLRLCDLSASLAPLHEAHLRPILTQSGRVLTLHATDPLRSENERPVRLTPDGVEAGTRADREWIAADIRQFAQLYTGHCLPSEAASLGLLSASSAEALALADSLFPARHPYVAPPDQF